jgi:hypothetical protein
MSNTKKITEYLKYIFQKVRHNPSPQIILDGLNILGINIMPFYLFLKGPFNKAIPQLETGFDEYTIGLLGPQDMKEMSEIPFRNISEEMLLKRLRDGNLCFGIKYQDRLAAFIWCDLKSCNFKGCYLTLKEDEAYIFDVFTLIPFRRKGIASYLRHDINKELAKFGRYKFYSVSEYFNIPSVKFNNKLGGKTMDMGLLIELFHRWHFTLRLKRYRTRS